MRVRGRAAGGPSTGLPTLPAQADMMQVKWGSHGDYEIIALSPNSPQECFDLMIKAFNLAEIYRVPVFFMMDEVVGHMTERVAIPKASEIEIVERRFTAKPPEEYRPYAPVDGMVPEMVKAGDGYRIHITGLTHDERVTRHEPGDAGHARAPSDRKDPRQRRQARGRSGGRRRRRGRRGGLVRDHVTRRRRGNRDGATPGRQGRSPSHGDHLAVPRRAHPRAGRKIRAFVVPELNMGQMVLEVERAVAGRTAVLSAPHAGGTVHEPEAILARIMEAAQ